MSVERYDVAVSVYNNQPVADDSDATCLWTQGENSVLISNILRTDKTAAENEENSKLVIYARAYALLEDGTYIYGDVVEVTLQQLVMAIYTKWDSLTAAQQEAMGEMYNTFESTLSTWDIPNIKEALT